MNQWPRLHNTSQSKPNNKLLGHQEIARSPAILRPERLAWKDESSHNKCAGA